MALDVVDRIVVTGFRIRRSVVPCASPWIVSCQSVAAAGTLCAFDSWANLTVVRNTLKKG